MYKVGQLFMFRVNGVRALWAIVDVNLEKDEYTIECVENCALKGMRKTGSKSEFDKKVVTELPRIIPADESGYTYTNEEKDIVKQANAKNSSRYPNPRTMPELRITDKEHEEIAHKTIGRVIEKLDQGLEK